MQERSLSKRPPGRELFMAPLEIGLKPTELEMINFAYQCSKHGHKGQKRDDGTPFSEHPKSAAWIYIHELGGRDPRAIIVLLLHDMREDSYLLSLYRLSLNFGQDIASDVRAVTKLPKGKETTAEYLARIVDQGPWAILGKLCDRLHNVRDLGSCTPEKRTRQIAETKEYHLPTLIPALKCFGEPWEAYASKLEQKLADAMAVYAQ